ncbi:uncharacterized protein LOC129582162 isoform X2 [Paramacrobiotus metropolitanus]|uniref:uncharacterized protein LOC129582162 isoform X2 n=1 Tax=Paramacrobiotus metropolitanus TaxID=2943436 RepID=UPI0024459F26|nr:uncharacterized protein LOC129582162 isoform X2 [Paramacrobiotus metropolitanus]
MDDPDGESAVKAPVSCSRPSRDAQAEETQWLVETRIAMNPLFLFDVLPVDDRKPGKQDHLWQQISERFRQRFPALVPKTPLQLRAKWQKLLKRYRKDCRAVVSKVTDYSFMAHFRLIDTYFRNQADADYQRLMATVPDTDPSPGPAGAETEESVGMPDSSGVTVIVACETCVVPLCTHTADNTDPRLVRFIRLYERMPPRKAAFQQLQLPYVGKTHELYICTEHFSAEDVDITAVLPVRAQAMPTRNLPENSLNSLKKLPIEGNTALIDQRMQKYANGQWKILSLYRRGAAVCDGGNAENEKSEIKSKSPAWLHFRPAYPAGNVCNYCSKLFLANTTSTLLNHLRRFHAEHLAPEVNRELPVKRRRAVERGEDGDAGPYHSFQSELKLVEFITEINPFQHTEQIDYCAAWTKVLQAYNDAKVDERPLNYRPCRERLQKLLQASQLQALAFRPLFHRAAAADLQHLDTLLHTIQAAFDAYERARRDKPHWTLKTYPRRPKGSGLYQEPPAPPADPSVRVPRIRTNKPHLVKKHRQTCIIRGCTARMVDQKRLGVTLHRCLKKPADEDSAEKKLVYEKWVKAIGLENARAWDERNMICSRHFSEEMVEKLGGVGWKLKKGAYPVRMLRAGEFMAEKTAREKICSVWAYRCHHVTLGMPIGCRATHSRFKLPEQVLWNGSASQRKFFLMEDC